MGLIQQIYRLNIIPGPCGGKVLAPGNEPPSDVTSRTLLAEMRGRHCAVAVQRVLKTIPGTWVQTGDNWSGDYSGVRQQWLVFPPLNLKCCNPPPDYYKVLRELADDDRELDNRFEYGDRAGEGHDPSPEWDEHKKGHKQHHEAEHEGDRHDNPDGCPDKCNPNYGGGYDTNRGPKYDPYLPENNEMYGGAGVTPILPPWHDRYQG